MERTYIMIKPDGVQRGLVGHIIARFEDRGLKLIGLKMLMADEDLLMDHYAELKVHNWHAPRQKIIIKEVVFIWEYNYS